MTRDMEDRLKGMRAGSAASRLAAPWLAQWQALGDRERRLVVLAAVLIGGALLWLVALKPPLTLMREAPRQLDTLEAQTRNMQRLAEEARELRTAAQVSPAQSVAALRAASARLGPGAKLAVQGERAILTVDGVDGETLRAWLAEVRSGARARPVEAQLSRLPKGGYSGSVTVTFGAPA
jgi:general secretion pathway protein M